MQSIWVLLGEHPVWSLLETARTLLAEGVTLGAVVCRAEDAGRARGGGAQTVVLLESNDQPPRADAIASALWHAWPTLPSLILTDTGLLMTEVAARLAVMAGALLITGASQLVAHGDTLHITRPSHGGSLRTTLAAPTSRPLIVTLPGGRAHPAPDARPGPLQTVALVTSDDITVLGETPRQEAGALGDARVIVAGGRGLGSAAAYARLIPPLAAALGGTHAASGPIVADGWAPPARQVGQTGTSVSPDVYLAVGISGAIHHLAGIRAARTVAAINSDARAPIFAHAKYGIVGDAHELVPLLVAAIQNEDTGTT